jgi:transposase
MIVSMNTITLSDAERMDLTRRASSRAGRADDARRARLILLLELGDTWAEIREKLACNDAFIDRWSKRFREDRLAGLFSRHAGQKPSTLTPRLEARILEWTVKRKPTDGSTHWSTRKLAEQLNVSHMMVARVWRKHALKPQRLDRYMVSDDPDFETKAADIIGLYLNPPQHAAVFCVDEKTAIQALDRLDPVLPLSPGRAERHGFEYKRHGTLSLYAAFNTKTGEVLGKTAARHTSAEFVAFLTDLVVNQPRGKEIHVIADNLSAHKTDAVTEFLAAHPKVHMHFTPTYSSWLNQVELWFAKIERDVIARGVFTSISDLKRKLMRYIRQYNKAPKTVKWKYFDPNRRITTSTSAVTVHEDLRATRCAASGRLQRSTITSSPVHRDPRASLPHVRSDRRAQRSGSPPSSSRHGESRAQVESDSVARRRSAL